MFSKSVFLNHNWNIFDRIFAFLIFFFFSATKFVERFLKNAMLFYTTDCHDVEKQPLGKTLLTKT